MAYVSLYRKYRPQSFEELVGQDHVTRSLTNAINDDKLHHAYLFTGPRGTGKTSTARILAKSVNCEQGPTPAPCNDCAQCVGITEGTSVDVIELDMASHGGVDDARELRDRARFSPASARRKVYILDEVHMASTAAFNALLKLIEEPPAHVLFAMATTDPQKVLPTIMSRVQRLDLRRVGAPDVAGRVRDLVTREGGSIDDEALDAVVRAGDGSLRDTESVLEQVLSYAEGAQVTAQDVVEVLGQTPFEATAAVVDAMTSGNLAGSFAAIQDLLDQGADLRQFTTDLVGHVRDLLVLVVAPQRPDLVDATADRREALVRQAAGQSRDLLTVAIDELANALAEMRQGPARLALELAVARITGRVRGAASGIDAIARAASATDPDDSIVESSSDSVEPSDPPSVAAAADGEGAGEAASAGGTPDGSFAEDTPEARVEPVSEDEPVTEDEPVSEDEPVTQDEPAADEPAVDAAPADTQEPEPDELAPDGQPDAPGGDGTSSPEDPVESLSTPLAQRAADKAAAVLRDGMPTPDTTRPDGPAVSYAAPPDADEQAQLAAVVEAWPEVLERVRSGSARAGAMLAPATPARLRNRNLVLSYERTHGFHAEQVGSGEFDSLLVDAVQAVCDVAVRIDAQVDGQSVGGGRPKSDEPAALEGSPAARAAARARPIDDAASDDANVGASAPTGADDEPGSVVPTPLADLDPAEAMDRAAAALTSRLDATEVAVE